MNDSPTNKEGLFRRRFFVAGGKIHPPNELASCDPYQSDLYNKKEIPLGNEERGQTSKTPESAGEL